MNIVFEAIRRSSTARNRGGKDRKGRRNEQGGDAEGEVGTIASSKEENRRYTMNRP